jgi:hypothetical protein
MDAVALLVAGQAGMPMVKGVRAPLLCFRDTLSPHSQRPLLPTASMDDGGSPTSEAQSTVATTPFSKGIDGMTDDEQRIAAAIARAFETLSQRLSKELDDAFNQMAHLIGRAQKQQFDIIALVGKQAEAIKALADLVAKMRDDDVERHNEHAGAIEQLLQGQMKFARFTDGLATQYGQLFKALSNRLDAVEKEAFGPNYNQQPSTPPLN